MKRYLKQFLLVSCIVFLSIVPGCGNTEGPIPEGSNIDFINTETYRLNHYTERRISIKVAIDREDFGYLRQRYDPESIAIGVLWEYPSTASALVTDIWQEASNLYVRYQSFCINEAAEVYTPAHVVQVRKDDIPLKGTLGVILLDDYFREIDRTTVIID